jgi:hypothetical protein
MASGSDLGWLLEISLFMKRAGIVHVLISLSAIEKGGKYWNL